MIEKINPPFVQNGYSWTNISPLSPREKMLVDKINELIEEVNQLKRK